MNKPQPTAKPVPYHGGTTQPFTSKERIMTAHRPGRLDGAAPVPTLSGGPKLRERGAQRRDETVWCPSCRRDHRMVRCEDCGAELPSHFLIHLCEPCKQLRRTGVTNETPSESR